MHRIRLRYVTGPRADQIEVHPLTRHASLSLGRDPGCDVRFHPTQDTVVSRNHAMIEWTLESPPLFRISDLLSSNGTFLNGRRIGRSVLLRAGDRIQLGTGGPILEFSLDEGDGPVDESERRSVPSVTQEMDATTIRAKLPNLDE
ncbi:MAG TPA: FHA domain-containing protein [Xanthomonadales bacterium]|nr:FHA domain-containing protein [Xanthomonadales bacterium]